MTYPTWKDIKDIDLDRTIREAMSGIDTPPHRAAAAEALVSNISTIARMDHDYEVLPDLLTEEAADALLTLMAERGQRHPTSAARLQHVAALLVLGNAYWDAVESRVEKLIHNVVVDYNIQAPKSRGIM